MPRIRSRLYNFSLAILFAFSKKFRRDRGKMALEFQIHTRGVKFQRWVKNVEENWKLSEHLLIQLAQVQQQRRKNKAEITREIAIYCYNQYYNTTHHKLGWKKEQHRVTKTNLLFRSSLLLPPSNDMGVFFFSLPK